MAVLSSATATQTGAQISAPGFTTPGWLPVANDDGGAPGTEIEALLQNGACPDITSRLPERLLLHQHEDLLRLDQIGADTVAEFDVPWWYRTDFTATCRRSDREPDRQRGRRRGRRLGERHRGGHQTTVEGDYTRYTFDVTSLLQPATTRGLEVHPNNPNTMLTLDDVDWSQIPPDNNTGIQFPVQLQVSDGAEHADSHVVEANAADLSSGADGEDQRHQRHLRAQTGDGRRDDHPPSGGRADHRQPDGDRPGRTPPRRSRSPPPAFRR